MNSVHNANITSLSITDNTFTNKAGYYKHLMIFSSLTNITLIDMKINTGNDGLNSIGILLITTLNKSYLWLKNIILEEISNFI